LRFRRRASYKSRHRGKKSGDSASTAEEKTADELAYSRLKDESGRLRVARQFFARQLGPLPAFAGISVAAVSAFSDRIKDDVWLGVALGFFALMVVASIGYSRMPAYRELRAHRLRTMTEGQSSASPTDWNRAEYELEASIYGSDRNRGLLWRLPTRKVQADLQEQMDKERFGVFVVQVLFLLVIASLLLTR
jgi:hypothetical protein